MLALADALVPPGGELPGGAEVRAGQRALESIARMPRAVRELVAGQLALLEQGARLAGGSRLPFSARSREEREAILTRLARLPGMLGLATMPLKLPVLLAYAGSPEVLHALGVGSTPLVPLTEPLPPPVRLPTRSYPDVKAGTTEVVDVVVIGSGAGGAPVARAVARAGWSVAVVEEGEGFTREDFRGPALDRMARLYRDAGATVTAGRPPVLLPLGRAVGGTTVVNSGTCFRTPDRRVASWRERFGVDDLAPDDLGPYYEDVEATLGVAPVPWEVMGNNGRVVHRGAESLGLHGRPLDRNAAGCHGSGVCAIGCPVDGKRGVHLNFLPQAVEGGAVIFARTRVEGILRRGIRATGVRCTLLDERRRPAGTLTLHARRGVVVAAGTPFTPLLLGRSGLRSRDLGRHLSIHPATGVIGVFDEEIRGWQGVLQSYLVDSLAHRGVMIEATFPPPELSYGSADVDLPAGERKALFAKLPNIATPGVMVSDGSNGRVVGLGPGRTPLIRYDLARGDAARALEGILLCARILFAAGAKEVLPLIGGAGRLRTVAEAEAGLTKRWPVSAFRFSAYHPLGTARMGSVVDGWGRVRGAERLVVADGSVFPSSLGVNPQVTIMAFAERAADRILERW